MKNYMTKSIEELHTLLKNGEVTSEELVKESISKSHEIQEKYNAFVTILDDTKACEVTDNLLSGIPYGIKDNYSTKGILSTGSSNTLKDYIPFFTATAIENLEKSGAVAVNKTVLDEFGMGGTGTTGHTGIVRNPWDKNRMCAGSSAGSACAVAAGVYPYATGSDTGDSIRKPAAYCGIVGYKPTYGMISRYGLFPYASSLDTCGVLTRNVKDAGLVVDNMKGIDKNDMTSWDSSKINLYDSINGDVKGKKLCYIKELCDIENYPNADSLLKQHLENFHNVLKNITKLGLEVEEVSVDKTLLNALPSVYDVISYAEATSNMSNLTGLIFGPRGEGKDYIEMMKDYRTKNFSTLIKRRFVIGSYVLQADNKDRYFHNAQRVRRLLVDTWNELFEKYDAVILPVETGPARYLDEKKNIIDKDTRILKEHLQIANFGGFPSITIPDGFIKGLPVGLNLTGKCYDDCNILNIAYAIEGTMTYKNQIAKEVDMSKYKAIIGLEMHCEISETNTKVFSGAKNSYTDVTNCNIRPVDMAFPGTLPVVNKEAVRKALMASLILNCKQPEYIYFERKNYYYPDLPKGYQITQETKPAPVGIYGQINYELDDEVKVAYINNIHLEEDSAQMTHEDEYSTINYNRAGVPLLELVTEPCFHNADEAVAFLETMRSIYQYAGISEADSKKGQIRCDVNISIMDEELDDTNPDNYGTKVEIKNVNSFSSVRDAINYEIARQIELKELNKYDTMEQQTRRWDESSCSTIYMRSKVNAIDYKYFVEPNIPKFKLAKDWIEQIKAAIPPLATERKDKYINEFGVSLRDAKIIVKDKELANYFEKTVSLGAKPQSVANWLNSVILGHLNKMELEIKNLFLTPEMLKGLIDMVESNKISIKQAKEILPKALEEEKEPVKLINELGITQITDEGELTKIIQEVIEENPTQLEAYKQNPKLFDYFIGQVMKKSRGKANPALTAKILRIELDK